MKESDHLIRAMTWSVNEPNQIAGANARERRPPAASIPGHSAALPGMAQLHRSAATTHDN